MNDCVFSPVCEGACQCFAYLSLNSEEGEQLSCEYWERVREATEPVRQWLEQKKSERSTDD